MIYRVRLKLQNNSVYFNSGVLLFDLNKTSLKNRILKLVDNKSALDTLKKHQLERKEALTFDWAQKMATLVLE